jgi:hypothetical protein
MDVMKTNAKKAKAMIIALLIEACNNSDRNIGMKPFGLGARVAARLGCCPVLGGS